MAPTRGNASPGGDSQEHGASDPATIPIPLRRTRRTPHRRTVRLPLRYARPARPSTVWPCSQDDLREGTGLLANWLLNAVIKTVTTYTEPGHRVLLLDLLPYFGPSASGSMTVVWNRPQRDPYAGLHEAGWTVVRLGRGVQTQTAVAHHSATDEHLADASTELESGPGLRTDRRTTDQLDEPSTGSDSTVTAIGPDRYDLIITAAGPHALDLLRPTDWAGLLTPNGILAVITHGDQSRGRLTDPASLLVHAARHAGLRYLDRIALLRVPVRDDALAVHTPTTCSQAPTGSLTTSVRNTQVHDDLFVFTRQPAPDGAVDGEGAADA